MSCFDSPNPNYNLTMSCFADTRFHQKHQSVLKISFLGFPIGKDFYSLTHRLKVRFRGDNGYAARKRLEMRSVSKLMWGSRSSKSQKGRLQDEIQDGLRGGRRSLCCESLCPKALSPVSKPCAVRLHLPAPKCQWSRVGQCKYNV